MADCRSVKKRGEEAEWFQQTGRSQSVERSSPPEKQTHASASQRSTERTARRLSPATFCTALDGAEAADEFPPSVEYLNKMADNPPAVGSTVKVKRGYHGTRSSGVCVTARTARHPLAES